MGSHSQSQNSIFKIKMDIDSLRKQKELLKKQQILAEREKVATELQERKIKAAEEIKYLKELEQVEELEKTLWEIRKDRSWIGRMLRRKK